jgi:hypothetical protein
VLVIELLRCRNVCPRTGLLHVISSPQS